MDKRRNARLSLLCVLVLVAVALAVFWSGTAVVADEPELAGNGTEGNPYEIATVDDLQTMEDNLTAHYVLVADIDATETEHWNDGAGFDPVGDDPDDLGGEGPFDGTLDGDGHEISNLSIDRESTDFVGLFASLGEEATVSDLSLVNVSVRGNEHVGGLVGRIDTAGRTTSITVETVTVTGSVSGESRNVGGLAGSNAGGFVLDARTDISISSDATRVGGVVGANDGTLRNVTATGSITGEASDAGGVVGYNDLPGRVDWSTAAVNVSGDGQLGGFVGRNTNGAVIEDSVATGWVSGDGSTVGGFAGVNQVGSLSEASIRRSVARGNVSLFDPDSSFERSTAGGFVGFNDAEITHSYATGNVASEEEVGGLIGTNNGGTVTGSFAAGSVSGDEDIGGLVGAGVDDAEVVDSYWDVPSSGLTGSDGGVGLGDLDDDAPAAEMTGEDALDNMTGLGFDAAWEIQTEPDDYPALVWEVTENAHEEIRSCEVYSVIRQPGSYDLTADVASDDSCIEIRANDVVLDGNGHTISGEGDLVSNAYGVYLDGTFADIEMDNVTVTNVTVDGWDGDSNSGIFAELASNVTFTDIEARNSWYNVHVRIVDDIHLERVESSGTTTVGMRLAGVADGVVRNVTSSNIVSPGFGANRAILLRDDSGNPTANLTVEDVTVNGTENGGEAIRFEPGAVRDLTLRNVTVTHSDGPGILVRPTTAGERNITFEHTTVADGNDHGIVIRSAGVTVTNSIVQNHSGISHGIYVDETQDIEIHDSVVDDNEQVGIRIDDSSDISVVDTAARGNERNAIWIEGSEDVSFDRLDIGNSTAPGTTLSLPEIDDTQLGPEAMSDENLDDIDDPEELENIGRFFYADISDWRDGDPFFNVSLHYTDEDVFGVDESTLELRWYDGDEWVEIGSEVDTTEQVVTAETGDELGLFGVFGEEAGEEPLQEKWTEALDASVQYSTPALTDSYALVGGLGSNLTAFHRTDGSTVWEFERTGALSDSSPAIHDGVVYVGSGGGTLYALDVTDGSVAWTHGTDSAITSSPTVATTGGETTVFVGANDGTVWALDTTGGVLWSEQLDAAVYSGPAVADETVFVTTREGELVAMDAENGDEEWRYDTERELRKSSPVVDDGTVYLAADQVYAFDAGGDGTPLWTTDEFGGTATSSPVVDGDALYVGSDDGHVYAVDLATDSVDWQVDVGSPVEGSPALADGRLVVASLAGTVTVLDTDGTVLDSVSVDSEVRSSPVVDGETIYLGTGETLVALENLPGTTGDGGDTTAADDQSASERLGESTKTPSTPTIAGVSITTTNQRPFAGHWRGPSPFFGQSPVQVGESA